MRPCDHVGAVLSGGLWVRGVAGGRLNHDRFGQERSVPGAARDLRGELAVTQVQPALADDACDHRVPEGGRPAIAEQDLIAVGQLEQLAQPAAYPRDHLLDGLLSVRRAHDGAARGGERL